jgi:hypothetical protein
MWQNHGKRQRRQPLEQKNPPQMETESQEHPHRAKQHGEKSEDLHALPSLRQSSKSDLNFASPVRFSSAQKSPVCHFSDYTPSAIF